MNCLNRDQKTCAERIDRRRGLRRAALQGSLADRSSHSEHTEGHCRGQVSRLVEIK